jgi:hypothetical protein
MIGKRSQEASSITERRHAPLPRRTASIQSIALL